MSHTIAGSLASRYVDNEQQQNMCSRKKLCSHPWCTCFLCALLEAMAAEWTIVTITRFIQDYPSWMRMIDIKKEMKYPGARLGSHQLVADITVERPHHVRFLNIDRPQQWSERIPFP